MARLANMKIQTTGRWGMVRGPGNRIICCLLCMFILTGIRAGETNAADSSPQVLQAGEWQAMFGKVAIRHSTEKKTGAGISPYAVHFGDAVETGADGRACFRWYGPQVSRNCPGKSCIECEVCAGNNSRIRIPGPNQQVPKPAFTCSVDSGIVRFEEKIPRVSEACARVVVTPEAVIEVLPSESAAYFIVAVQQSAIRHTDVTVAHGKVKVRPLSKDRALERILQANETVAVVKDPKLLTIRQASGKQLLELVGCTSILPIEADPTYARASEPPESARGTEGVREVPLKRHSARPHGAPSPRPAPTAPLTRGKVHAKMTYPQFPWPPPRASVVEVVPSEMLELPQGPTLLRDVDRRISGALAGSGYFDSRYYAVPDGFALVTRMEQIESDGSPKSGSERWEVEVSPAHFSLDAYLKALFYGRPGNYRIIVFIVTPYDITDSGRRVTEKWAKGWLKGGMHQLPESLGDLQFSQAGYTCSALIYEFERPQKASPIEVRCPGKVSARNHLVKAGIWDALQARSK